MKHAYKDKMGRFAKIPEVVDHGKDTTISNDRIKIQCDFEKPIAKIPKGLHPSCEFDTDPSPIFDAAPHNGNPKFAFISPNTYRNIRIIGNVIPFRQHFKSLNEKEELCNRYLVEIYDHDDNSFKFLVCGKSLVQQIYQEICQITKDISPKTKFDKIINWFRLKVLRQKKIAKPIDLEVRRNSDRYSSYSVRRAN